MATATTEQTEERPRPSANGTRLRTRKPTGNVAFPFVLVEGEPKGGKSYALAQLAASPRVGRTFILELGETGMDEYASLGPFEIIVHNGMYSDIRGQVAAALAEPHPDGKPNVIGIDSGTALWTLLKDWTDQRARNSSKNRAILQRDPDAEIDPTMNLWNDAKGRWREIVDALVAWPGIAVMVARAGEVAKVEGGQPVANQTEYRVEAEKTLVFDATAQVRFYRGQRPRLVAAKSLFLDIPAGGIELPRENCLDHLVFDVLSGGKPFGSSTVVLPQVGLGAGTAKARVLQAVQRANPALSDAEAKAEAGRHWDQAFPEGAKEVTEVRLAEVLAGIGGTHDGGSADAPDAPNRASDQPPQARVLSGPEVAAKVRAMDKRDLVPLLLERDLSTAGSLNELQDRLLVNIGLPDPSTEPFTEAPQVAPSGPETPAATDTAPDAPGAAGGGEAGDAGSVAALPLDVPEPEGRDATDALLSIPDEVRTASDDDKAEWAVAYVKAMRVAEVDELLRRRYQRDTHGGPADRRTRLVFQILEHELGIEGAEAAGDG